MELNDDCSSEWLTEMTKLTNTNTNMNTNTNININALPYIKALPDITGLPNTSELYFGLPTINSNQDRVQCNCQPRRISVAYDGGRTQRCDTCGETWTQADTIWIKK